LSIQIDKTSLPPIPRGHSLTQHWLGKSIDRMHRYLIVIIIIIQLNYIIIEPIDEIVDGIKTLVNPDS
jgi:hypothetical protein